MAALQRSDSGAHRGLSQVQLLRRAGHVQNVGYGDKNAKLFKCHSIDLSY